MSEYLTKYYICARMSLRRKKRTLKPKKEERHGTSTLRPRSPRPPQLPRVPERGTGERECLGRKIATRPEQVIKAAHPILRCASELMSQK